MGTVVIQFVEKMIAKRRQSIEKAWQNFVQTSELHPTYATPDALFEDFTIQASPQAQQAFHQLFQTLPIRKRLIAVLNDVHLKKMIPMIQKKAHVQILPHIDTVLALQHYADTQGIPQQDFRNIWWEVALKKSMEAPAQQFREKVWLFKSLAALVDALAPYESPFAGALTLVAEEVL